MKISYRGYQMATRYTVTNKPFFVFLFVWHGNDFWCTEGKTAVAYPLAQYIFFETPLVRPLHASVHYVFLIKKSPCPFVGCRCTEDVYILITFRTRVYNAQKSNLGICVNCSLLFLVNLLPTYFFLIDNFYGLFHIISKLNNGD